MIRKRRTKQKKSGRPRRPARRRRVLIRRDALGTTAPLIRSSVTTREIVAQVGRVVWATPQTAARDSFVRLIVRFPFSVALDSPGHRHRTASDDAIKTVLIATGNDCTKSVARKKDVSSALSTHPSPPLTTDCSRALTLHLPILFFCSFSIKSLSGVSPPPPPPISASSGRVFFSFLAFFSRQALQ